MYSDLKFRICLIDKLQEKKTEKNISTVMSWYEPLVCFLYSYLHCNVLKIKTKETGKMIQWEKALDSKPHILRLIPKTIQQKVRLNSKVVLWLPLAQYRVYKQNMFIFTCKSKKTNYSVTVLPVSFHAVAPVHRKKNLLSR